MSKSDGKKLNDIPAYRRTPEFLKTANSPASGGGGGGGVEGGRKEQEVVVDLISLDLAGLGRITPGDFLVADLMITPIAVATRYGNPVGNVASRDSLRVKAQGNQNPRVLKVDVGARQCQVAF